MKKFIKYLYAIILSIITIPAVAQDYSVGPVLQFANSISKWTSTHRDEFRFEAEDLCNGSKKAIVNDDFSHILTKRNNPNAPLQKSYELETYLNNIGNQVSKGTINITYTNISEVSKKDIVFESKISDKDLGLTELYSCKIKVTGDIQHESNELFYVYKNKIAKIGKYEKKNGKVVVKFDDFINDYETIGISYNYGKYFPVGISVNYSPENIPFMISVDVGVNFDKDKYVIDRVEMKDIMNFNRTKKVYDPQFFLTVTPQLYLKYFAIGCGAGIMMMDGTEETANYEYASSSLSGNAIETGSGILVKPMIRPVIKGFIPLNDDDLFLSVSVGYDYVFGYKEKNGINFGVGIQLEL